MANRRWDESEIQFLKDKWGEMSVARIAKKLNRTIDAVRVKATRIGLTTALNHLDGVTLNQLAKVFNVSYGWTIDRIWNERLKIPYKTKIIKKTRPYRYIGIDDFWKWASKNKHAINFSKLEPGALGKEPGWVKEKRKADKENLTYKKKSVPWTKAEESLLKTLLAQFRFTYPQISKRLGRTEGAIRVHLTELGWPERPISGDIMPRWTDEEIKTMLKMKSFGYGNCAIAETLGRTMRAIERKLEGVREEERWQPYLAPHLIKGEDTSI